MTQTFQSRNIRITLNKKGSRVYTKMSFPVHCGLYHEIETKDHVLQFNLCDEIFRVKGKTRDWAHPHEWLKRTQGNDWVYYSTGGYTGVFEATGEYYLPNFQYPTNSILGGHPFANETIDELSRSWHNIVQDVRNQSSGFPEEIRMFLDRAVERTPEYLEQKADRLLEVIGGRISVLPPDARHVDYNLIPLTISRGCLYKCAFCKVKNQMVFSELSEDKIRNQLVEIKKLFKGDLINYNSIFLGEHDALLTNPGRLFFSIEEGYRKFGCTESYLEGSNIFLFGSVASLLGHEEGFFKELDVFPGNKYINIGLESADQQTLDRIGKPLSERQVREAFSRSQEINDRFASIEATANFIMDENLPENHYKKILQLLREEQTFVKAKGTIYFSPLTFDRPSRSRLFEFNRIKIKSRLPTYLYIIQRL